ncbi:MAG: glycosyltransferase [Verrucomicrobia bacterium]|nr:glycosyltransferase [Verrucomicrobiota bacterium]
MMNRNDNFDLSEAAVLEKADLFLKQGSLSEAIDVLVNWVAKSNLPASSEVNATLARIAYSQEGWQEAAELWRQVVDEESGHIESRLCRAHCLAELNEKESFAEALKELMSCLRNSGGLLTSTEADQFLELLYKRLFYHYTNSDAERVDQLLEICTPTGGYAGRAIASESSSPALSTAEIEKTLTDAWQAFCGATNATNELEEISLSELPKRRDKPPRVLLVFRTYFFHTASSRKHEFPMIFKSSGKSMGIEVSHFSSEVLSGPSVTTDALAYEGLQKLIRWIAGFEPDLIIFDDLGVEGGISSMFGQDRFKELMLQLKGKFRFKLAGIYPDPWASVVADALPYASEFADLIWNPCSRIGSHFSEFGTAKRFCLPVPFPYELYQDSADVKSGGAVFLGGVKGYNYLRAVWLSLMRQTRSPCRILVSSHIQNESHAGDTLESYASFMSRTEIMVNFSARTPNKKTVTGRVWESIASKTLLIEEDSEEIRSYFVPFVHYIPFLNIGELNAYLSFFLTHTEWRERICDQAFRWFRRHYSQEVVWSKLLSPHG